MITLVRGNALHIPLPDKSVQCVVTSPPYWGLRDYGTNGQLGLEKTPEEYVANMVAVFREVWRVMRDDGTLWLNLGDSYHQGNKGNSGERKYTDKQSTNKGSLAVRRGEGLAPNRKYNLDGIKPKDMCMIPARVALALQADGWYLRSDIIWHKPNPMPESVQDRPTKAHEYLFLLTKAERYYYDAEAVKEESTGREPGNNNHKGVLAYENGDNHHRTKAGLLAYSFKRKTATTPPPGQPCQHREDREDVTYAVTRNKRTVWTIATSPYSGAHFATFPPALVEPCVLAGTSARGQCPQCGAPWRRIVDRKFVPQPDVSLEKGIKGGNGQKPSYEGNSWDGTPRGTTAVMTIGWAPSCTCSNDDPVPQIVLDPFSGSGTVGQVCLQHGRRYVGVELKPDYIELAQERLYNRQIGFGL